MNAVGFIELNSIARGYETADSALKTSDVQMLFCRPGCPGKFYFLYKGDPSAVEAAAQRAVQTGGDSVVDHTVIANLHEEVIEAMTMTTGAAPAGALGILEFFSVTAAVYAADAAVKSADIRLIEIRIGMGIGGKAYVAMTGSVSAVETAVKAGIREENARGLLVHSTVIANPDAELLKSLY